MEEKIRILLLENSADDVRLIKHQLKKEGIIFSCRLVETHEKYQQELYKFVPDVVISDHSMPQFNSLEALEIFCKYRRERHTSSAFVLVTGTVSEEFAVKVMKNGADDYILKDRLKRLPSAVLNAIEKNKLKVQRRQMEEEKLHLLDILQKSLHEIFVFHAETYLFEYANEEAQKNLGYILKEIQNFTPLDLIHEFNKENIHKILEGVKKSKKGRIFESYAIRKDGSKYPIQIHLQIVELGAEKKFLANVLDITESKAHEQQQKLAIFIQNCFNEGGSLESSLKLVLGELCSRADLPAAGIWARNFEETEIKCFAWYDAEGKERRPEGDLFAEVAFARGKRLLCKNLEKEKIIENLEGSRNLRFPVLAAQPVKSGNDIEAVIVVFSKEVIEERNPFINLKEGVQDKLASNIKRKKTEEELQKIFEVSPDVLAVVSKDGYFKKVNPSFEKLLGMPADEILSVPFVELIHPHDLHIVEKWKETKSRQNEVMYYESRWRTARGDYRWFSWSVTPFLEEENLSFAVGKDITDYKEKVRAIQWQNRKLAEIAWEQSHVVRAPLARMMSCIAYLEENDEHKEMILKNLEDSAYELDRIVKKIVNTAEQIKSEV